MTEVTLDKITALAKRRGFVFLTSSIYGGLANNYDYGPYGAQLKNNIRDLWWKKFVNEREDIVGLDGAILMQSKVWEASGHTGNFNEALVEDKVTNKRYRADHLIEAWLKKNKEKVGDVNVELMDIEEMNEFIVKNKILSPDGNPISELKLFNQMFSADLDFMSEDEVRNVYLRPETAQAIFVNFKNVTDTMRVRLPFGIAQVGKAFRKEITKGQFIFRTIETEQMEIEYFIAPPKTDEEWSVQLEKWLEDMKDFYMQIGAKEENIRFRQHTEEELSHYSKRTYDPEYQFDFGWKEIAGLAYRTDFDLKQHEKFSGQKLAYKDPITNESYIPHVIEPSIGLARAVLVALYSAYTEEKLENGTIRTVLKFPPKIAPVQVAVFPLQKDAKLAELAKDIFKDLNKQFVCEYDNAGSIGKMYRRQDEIGTPYCVTIDFDSLDDKKVTVRDRDTMKQERVEIDKLGEWLKNKIN